MNGLVRYLLCCVLCFVPILAWAELGSYGYIVGTLDQTTTHYSQTIDEKEFAAPAYGLEFVEQQGKFLHYIFFVNVNGTRYKVVVDVNDAMNYPVPYRIVNLRYANYSYYKGIFSSTGYVELNNKSSNKHTSKANGGLDFLRHPGILKDMAGGRGWTDNPIDMFDGSVENSGVWDGIYLRRCVTGKEFCPEGKTLYYIDAFDALFKNVRKVYVFGEKFNNSGELGMHNVHQNQGNRDNRFVSSGATYQDGGVIFEYTNGERKLLMVKFGDYVKNGSQVKNQLDFSYSENFQTEYYINTTVKKQAGEGARYYVDTYEFVPSKTNLNHGMRIGPFYGDQIEVLAFVNDQGTANEFADVDLYMGDSPSVTSSSYLIFARNSGSYNEYLRASSDLWSALGASNINRFYIYVNLYSNGMTTQRPVHIVVRHR